MILSLLLLVMTSLSNAQNIEQLLLATGSDSQANDQFGYAVDISGDYAIVGAKNVAGTSNTGKAYVFKRDGDVWSELQVLTSSATSTGYDFGYSVAIDGDFIAVGEPLTYRGETSSGSVYVYKLNTTSGLFSREKIIGGTSGERFGMSVDVIDFGDGDCRVVGGTPYKNGGKGGAKVTMRISGLGGSNWTQGVIIDNTTNEVDYMGTDVAIGETNVLVSAPKHTIGGITEVGEAYRYEISTVDNYVYGVNYYSYEAQLELTYNYPDLMTTDQFGTRVAMSRDGKTVAISAPYVDLPLSVNAGQVVVFTDNATGVDTSLITNSTLNGHINGRFGFDVALKGDSLVVGAYNAFRSQGEVTLFYRDRSETDPAKWWKKQQKLALTDVVDGMQIGQAIGFDGQSVIMGAYPTNSNQGKIYIAGIKPDPTDPSDPTALLKNKSLNASLVYPNPVTNNVLYFSQGEMESVKIFDQQGQSVLEAKDVTSVDVSKLVDGLYMIQGFNKGVLSQSKFLKETK